MVLNSKKKPDGSTPLTCWYLSFNCRSTLGASTVPYTSITATTGICTRSGLSVNFAVGFLQERIETNILDPWHTSLQPELTESANYSWSCVCVYTYIALFQRQATQNQIHMVNKLLGLRVLNKESQNAWNYSYMLVTVLCMVILW